MCTGEAPRRPRISQQGSRWLHPNSRLLAAIAPLLLAASPRREMFTSGSSRLSDGPGMHRAVFLCPCSCTKTCPCPRFYKCPGGGGNPAPGDEARNAERLSPSSPPDLQTRHSRRTLGYFFFFFGPVRSNRMTRKWKLLVVDKAGLDGIQVRVGPGPGCTRRRGAVVPGGAVCTSASAPHAPRPSDVSLRGAGGTAPPWSLSSSVSPTFFSSLGLLRASTERGRCWSFCDCP